MDFIAVKRVFSKLYKNGENEAAGILRNVLIGAYWTESRVKEAGYVSSTSGLCPRCGASAESPEHRSWDCDCNRFVADSIVDRTNHLRGRVKAEPGRSCLWCRGLPPLEDSCGHLPAPVQLVREWGRLTDGRKIDGGVWGIDGSGGSTLRTGACAGADGL